MNRSHVKIDPATQRLAGRLFRTMQHTLINRGLCQTRKDGSLREVNWLAWTPWLDRRAFAFVMDTSTLPVSLEKLTNPKVVHQVSTALGGRPVVVTNHRGVLWSVGMDLPPLEDPKRRLPKRVDLDLRERPSGEYTLGLGLSARGPVWLNLETACHIMVGGSSDSGKSGTLRSIVFQLMLMPEPVQVVLADMEGRTFGAFEGLPRIPFPIAEDLESATRLTAWLMDEMEQRSRLFDASPYYPENLGEYHQALWKQHGCLPDKLRLPRIVAIFDEFSALLEQAGQRSEIYRHISQLAMRSRKYGVTLVYAGQDFKSDLINTRVTHQVRTRIAHRCESHWQSKNVVGVAGAERLSVQGRALVSLNKRQQVVQCFWVPKSWILYLQQARKRGQPAAPPSPLSGLQREMVRFAVEELGGEFKITALLEQFKGRIGKKDNLIQLARAWEARSWLTKLKQRNTPRRVTPKLLAAAGLEEKPNSRIPGDPQQHETGEYGI